MNTFQLKEENSKSYATEANLMKALEKAKLTKYRPLIVKNIEGRFTAIFIQSFSNVPEGELATIAWKGFFIAN